MVPPFAPKRILGIDPGTRVMGVGVIDSDGRDSRYVACEALRASASAPRGERLLALHDQLQAQFERHRPAVVALESAFVGKNSASALAIGEARGMALLCAARAGVAVFEYPPASVKRAIAGFGGAEKEQLAHWIARLLGLREAPTPFDASDALAIALAHAHRMAAPALQAALGRPRT
jgi:crossover junction endodeoxyribonuclease RuvC